MPRVYVVTEVNNYYNLNLDSELQLEVCTLAAAKQNITKQIA